MTSNAGVSLLLVKRYKLQQYFEEQMYSMLSLSVNSVSETDNGSYKYSQVFLTSEDRMFLDPPWNLAVYLLQSQVGYKLYIVWLSVLLVCLITRQSNQSSALNRVDVFTNKLQLVTTHLTTHSYILHSHGAVAAYIQKLLDLSKQHIAMNKTLQITGKKLFIYITNNKI